MTSALIMSMFWVDNINPYYYFFFIAAILNGSICCRKSSPLFERCQGNQYVVRTPYHMYNVKGELRYIVQDAPHLEQCYLEAQCR